MIDHYTLVQRLTGQFPVVDQGRRLNDFAFELGWRPSDHLQIPASDDFATAHLIVEHGLEYTAVISFLRHPNRFVHLQPVSAKNLGRLIVQLPGRLAYNCRFRRDCICIQSVSPTGVLRGSGAIVASQFIGLEEYRISANRRKAPES
jgi:hypothetical protein